MCGTGWRSRQRPQRLRGLTDRCNAAGARPASTAAAPVRHEYSWLANVRGETAASPLLIVLSDSTVRLAAAMWQQDGALHFQTPEGTPGVTLLGRSAERPRGD